MLYLQSSSSKTEKNNLYNDLLNIFGNKNKVNAIVDIWQNREKYSNGYYLLKDAPLEAKLSYLYRLPYIGKITKNHLARNLGEDVPKYDIWVQRLGVMFSGRKDLESKINNSKLSLEIVKVCDNMFKQIKQETGLPIGYIDLVLWRACEQNILKELK
jgi:thermostable 8-oxoguanine DNA glycosylase